jgi:hypothetical protein
MMRMFWMKSSAPLGERKNRIRGGGLFAAASAVLALFFAGTTAGMAAESSDMAGIWQITRDQDAKQCRISLNAERSGQGDFIAGIPPGCRRAMPALAKAASWSMTDTSHLSLTSQSGDSVLDFSREGGGPFTAQSPDGASYRLVLIHLTGGGSVTGIDLAAETAAPPVKPAIIQLGAAPAPALALKASKPAVVAAAAKATAPAVPPAPALPVPTTAEMAGRYSLLRDKRDTGCMLTLDNGTRVKGGDRAALAPACRDQGIVVFDPVAWQIVKGRLVLTAKAGHVTHLDLQADGSWAKDPAEGRSLTLKKY